MIGTLRERNNKAARKYRKSHPERRRFIQAPRLGTTKAAADERLIEQNYRCAICFEVFTKTPHIDHDHETNEFRGLLCRPCNHLLGNARDKILVLENAIQYLKKYGAENGKKKSQVYPFAY